MWNLTSHCSRSMVLRCCHEWNHFSTFWSLSSTTQHQLHAHISFLLTLFAPLHRLNLHKFFSPFAHFIHLHNIEMWRNLFDQNKSFARQVTGRRVERRSRPVGEFVRCCGLKQNAEKSMTFTLMEIVIHSLHSLFFALSRALCLDVQSIHDIDDDDSSARDCSSWDPVSLGTWLCGTLEAAHSNATSWWALGDVPKRGNACTLHFVRFQRGEKESSNKWNMKSFCDFMEEDDSLSHQHTIRATWDRIEFFFLYKSEERPSIMFWRWTIEPIVAGLSTGEHKGRSMQCWIDPKKKWEREKWIRWNENESKSSKSTKELCWAFGRVVKLLLHSRQGPPSSRLRAIKSGAHKLLTNNEKLFFYRRRASYRYCSIEKKNHENENWFTAQEIYAVCVETEYKTLDLEFLFRVYRWFIHQFFSCCCCLSASLS